ncbi:GTPase HflX [Syntrophorhabdus aromaticivorans]|uniref:GTPase HflX n=1 Tax=Syntrophorhabdus aromaticivorans TaxID=328301 RepID=A0A351U7T4_9BACT|nr:GTPase HflX [Syntrophorhabdus aromaticivorans]NLW34817.1 GTPase HflX [Syntrophorhabdus aromaticivorans]HBA56015.1 GTPase HflX [Syntrophorhabdus aromaticivorans]
MTVIEVYGNVQGLNHLVKRRLENLYKKKVEATRIIPFDTARNILQISREILRQVGLLINRRGVVEYVIVGDRTGIRIPPLSTERVGRARFRGVRFVHTHLGGELLSKEDLTDLALLQLDLVACITERRDEGTMVHVGHLIPENKKNRAWDFIGPLAIQDLDIDFIEFITELENEFVKERGRYYVLDNDSERCVLVSIASPKRQKDMDDHMAELKDLCYSAGIAVLDTIVQRPREFRPKHLIGKGKMEEIVIRCRQLGVDLLVFDDELSPGQIKNISSITELRVIDRNQLILDIFAGRANTNEAKIQVELAQLRYILPRLAETDIAFSRLTGGIGARGPGETKLEVDKRRIRDRIALLEKKLREVRKVREKKREKRRLSGIPIVSIIGYTNSGKSTLLNLLTKSRVDVEDKPFSTLNPTTRLIKYPERKNIIVTDTVGFIKDLPQVLLRAFIATLEELGDAHLLLHLVDISSPDFEERIRTVEDILATLNLGRKERLIVFNKIDKIEGPFLKYVEDRYKAVSISSLKKTGIDRLIGVIEAKLAQVEP